MARISTIELDLASESETAALARRLASAARPADAILLAGELGVGKSTFARAFIAALGGTGEVPSPTFTLVQTYDTPRGTVWHFDLFRLDHPDEVVELGIDEALTSGISLIEWPERLGPHRPPEALRLELAYASSPERRRIAMTCGAAWIERLPAIVEPWFQGLR